MPYEKIESIKTWAEDDRPREKLVLKGRNALSDAELIAILIGSGNREESAVSLSKRILSSVENNLDKLARLTLADLMKFKGIGEAKAISIIAALEVGRRKKDSSTEVNPSISNSRDAYLLFLPVLEDLPHEESWVLLMNRANKVIQRQSLSVGGIHGTVIDSKILFKMAIDKLASGIILAHNHPSGNVKPSDDDIRLTSRLSKAGKILEIPILDHLIIAGKNYFSFADEDMMNQ